MPSALQKLLRTYFCLKKPDSIDAFITYKHCSEGLEVHVSFLQSILANSFSK